MPRPAATPPLPPLPSTCTAGWLATHYLDIRGSPRRGFFELLAHFCPSEVEKEKLTEFTTAEGQVGAGREALPLMCSHLSPLPLSPPSPSPEGRRSCCPTATDPGGPSQRCGHSHLSSTSPPLTLPSSPMQVLADFPSASSHFPLHYLLDLMPPLQPRPFSIASSMEVGWVGGAWWGGAGCPSPRCHLPLCRPTLERCRSWWAWSTTGPS